MTEPAQQPQPSVQDAQQVGQAATDAALNAPTPEQARTDAAAAARRAGAEKGIEIGESEAKMIADAVVSAMEARGAFDAPIEPVAPPPAPPGEASVPPAAAGAAQMAAVEQPPRKRSFAQKFLGE